VPARILDGKALAQSVRADLKARVARLKAETGIVPGLTVVLVGEHPASAVYVRNKETAARQAGMAGAIRRLPDSVEAGELLAVVDELNADPAVHGILVQLPLPSQIDDQAVIERIDPRKDVDGFHPDNAGRLAIGRPRFVSCTPLGVQSLLIAAGVPTRGAHAVVLGRSNIVGKPMAQLLLQKGEGGDATVTVCHTGSRDVPAMARTADVLIAAMGRPEAVRGDWIKPGAAVVDVGIHRCEDGSLCGDVAYDEAAQVAGWITPVPGGVGPLTVAMLLKNTLKAAALAAGRPDLIEGEPGVPR